MSSMISIPLFKFGSISLTLFLLPELEDISHVCGSIPSAFARTSIALATAHEAIIWCPTFHAFGGVVEGLTSSGYLVTWGRLRR